MQGYSEYIRIAYLIEPFTMELRFHGWQIWNRDVFASQVNNLNDHFVCVYIYIYSFLNETFIIIFHNSK